MIYTVVTRCQCDGGRRAVAPWPAITGMDIRCSYHRRRTQGRLARCRLSLARSRCCAYWSTSCWCVNELRYRRRGRGVRLRRTCAAVAVSRAARGHHRNAHSRQSAAGGGIPAERGTYRRRNSRRNRVSRMASRSANSTPHHHARKFQSTGIFAALITLPHLTISAFM